MYHNKLNIIIIACLILVSGCSNDNINSKWNDDNVRIDGDFSEWSNNLHYLKNEEIALGVSNDSENLYLCLTTTSSNVMRQIFGRGFSVWIDHRGKKRKSFGIKFPVGLINRQQGKLRERFDMAKNERGNRNESGNFSDVIHTEFEMIDADGCQILPLLNNGTGIMLKLSRDRGRLIYELKVPFNRISEKLAVNKTKKSQEIRIGLMANSVDRDKMRDMNFNARTGGRGIGGGMSGGKMGSRGGTGGSIRSQPRNIPAPLEHWIKVSLTGDIKPRANE